MATLNNFTIAMILRVVIDILRSEVVIIGLKVIKIGNDCVTLHFA